MYKEPARNEYWEMPRIWAPYPVVVIATGPSLTKEQIDRIYNSNAAVICVNDAYQAAPWCDMVYACDLKWWKWHYADVVARAQCTRVISGHHKEVFQVFPDLNVIQLKHAKGFSLDNRHVHAGKNSGYQAVNLALLSGTRTVVMVGFDHHKGPDGRSHFFGEHKDGFVSTWHRWLPEWDSTPESVAKAGVEVINATPGSAIKTYPYRELDDALRYAESRVSNAPAIEK